MPRWPSKAYSDSTPVSTSGVRSSETKTASAGADSSQGMRRARAALGLGMSHLLGGQHLHVATVPAEGDRIAFVEGDGFTIGGVHTDHAQFGFDFQHPDAAQEKLGLNAAGQARAAGTLYVNLFQANVGMHFALQAIGRGFKRVGAHLHAAAAFAD